MGFVRSLNTSVIQSISSTGDKCHFNIAISEKEARSVIMGISINEFTICINGNYRSVEEKDLIL